jgi:colicin import membrane protein
VHIDKDGRILNYRLVQPSGQPNFDASTVKSVAETETLPPPPAGLNVLQLRFTSQELGQ